MTERAPESRGRRQGDQRTEISFAALSDGFGVEVVDPIDRYRYSLYTPRPVSPRPASTDQFVAPVDAAVTVTADRITLPTVVATYVRNTDGDLLAEAEHFAAETLPEDVYILEICAPIKIYLRVEGRLSVTADLERMWFAFDTEAPVAIGARSRHEHPAGTVTTTEAPDDVMAAVASFGSALKTTSPERSYPTLRGHPPLVEVGDTLDIPAGLEAPDTGVRLEVPPEYRFIYTAAPLAHYLGADLVPADTPRLVTDTGFEHPLDTTRGVEGEIERVLKQTFFLDCVTRTEGYYQVDLHEREAIEPVVDLEFADIYGRPLAEQLEAYLAVPFALLEDHLPEWKLTTHVAPTPDSVELLPFVVNDLAVIRTPRGRDVPNAELQMAAVEDYLRYGGTLRSTASGTTDTGTYFQPETAESLGQAWIGDGAPIGASKVIAEAYRNGLDRTPTEGDIAITVVCNDPEMDEERDVVDDVYGSREDLSFSVAIHHDLTTDELRGVLASQADFLHYIGHVDDEGFECADGKFDAAALDDVGIDAFLLNACQSYQQGTRLLEAGAIGGIVTLSDVINSGAVRIGRAIARLLNQGFPLRAALDIARNESFVGGQYIVVGDGGLSITQTESGGVPNLCEIEATGDSFEVTFKAYPTAQRDLGTLVIPYIETINKHYLASGPIDTFTLSREELVNFLAIENIPLTIERELHWSGEFNVEKL